MAAAHVHSCHLYGEKAPVTQQTACTQSLHPASALREPCFLSSGWGNQPPQTGRLRQHLLLTAPEASGSGALAGGHPASGWPLTW